MVYFLIKVPKFLFTLGARVKLNLKKFVTRKFLFYLVRFFR